MRTVILLTILAVLPISCKFYLYREFAQGDNALEIAQKIMDTIVLGLKTNDVDLCLSVIDKSYRHETCGRVVTYSDLESKLRNRNASEPIADIEITNAVIEGDLLKFEIVEKRYYDKLFFTAVRKGAEFKITTSVVDKKSCEPRRRYLQEDVGEYIY